MNIVWGSFWKLGRDIQQLTARALMQVPELFVLLRDPQESPLPNLCDYYHIAAPRKLGSGSFGTVLVMQPHRTTDCDKSVEHAIKVDWIVKHGVALPDGACGEPPYLCIAMPRVDGHPLTAVLRSCTEEAPPVSLGASSYLLARVLAPQLFAAFAYMHEQGICHRDVWPDNLVVSDSLVVTIVDLGCASYYGDGLCNDSGARQLNLNYASPEVYHAHAVQLQNWPGTPQQDCWAVGLVLGEVIEGCVISMYLGNSLPVQDASFLHQLLVGNLENLQQGYGRLLEAQPEKRMTMEDAQSGWA
eukprot:CAMPEP_0169157454 /NCGR_PEP_ID=MMETSP1015-20121227/54597_1 /TAXON_ID=342587 /ORGANISM="Karlodinium micrum, Strain CCMP2283" /LENGTH=300 /DNA_ID=CAMNT_0009228399 /DNA_START=17 /DNA_END=916 /DNA_ORIENTATION=+